jgi:glycolate oxidase FAD binding subunit
MNKMSSDSLPPTLQRWRDQIVQASASREPLRIRGGDSKAFYGEPSDPAHATLDTREHRGIVSYEPSELVVTARAGTPLRQVEAALAERGQRLPFEPPHFGPDATIGGMVAAGLSGPARASVGAVRDFVLGAQLLNGRGDALTFGGQVMKNVAGYDVSRLLAGSLGALGVITEVSLKVLPRAAAEATLCFDLPQAEALAQLARWRSQPLPLNASCWVHDHSDGRARDCLFVRLRGAAAAVDAACTRMLADAPGQRQDTAATAKDWEACREQTLPFFHPPAPELGLWRLSVAQTAPVLPLDSDPLVEWHGALRWTWAPVSEASRLRDLAQRAGGHATLFRAPASTDAATPSRFTPPQGPLLAIQNRLKAEFDPAGILNPGRWGFLA